MLASICSIRRWILLGVKFLSRLLTALNLLPSIATIASENRSSWRHSSTNKLFAGRTDSRAIVLAEIRDRLEVRRQPARQPHHLEIAPRLPFQSSARLNPIEIAVKIDLQ